MNYNLELLGKYTMQNAMEIKKQKLAQRDIFASHLLLCKNTRSEKYVFRTLLVEGIENKLHFLFHGSGSSRLEVLKPAESMDPGPSRQENWGCYHTLGQLGSSTAGTVKGTRGANCSNSGCRSCEVSVLITASQMLHLHRDYGKETLIISWTQPSGSQVAVIYIPHSKTPLTLGRENILTYFIFTPLSCILEQGLSLENVPNMGIIFHRKRLYISTEQKTRLARRKS